MKWHWCACFLRAWVCVWSGTTLADQGFSFCVIKAFATLDFLSHSENRCEHKWADGSPPQVLCVSVLSVFVICSPSWILPNLPVLHYLVIYSIFVTAWCARNTLSVPYVVDDNDGDTEYIARQFHLPYIKTYNWRKKDNKAGIRYLLTALRCAASMTTF